MRDLAYSILDNWKYATVMYLWDKLKSFEQKEYFYEKVQNGLGWYLALSVGDQCASGTRTKDPQVGSRTLTH